MTLTIKNHDANKEEIELTMSGNDADVKIDGELMACFYKNGEFIFYGKGDDARFVGRWKE